MHLVKALTNLLASFTFGPQRWKECTLRAWGMAEIEPIPSGSNETGHRFHLLPTWLRGRIKALTHISLLPQITSLLHLGLLILPSK